ncbi:e3 ubiquitin-protein ligase trim [Anaeramoeba flamelloides]|uniref:E3 ubiquitin-protein ligase trim n=1 Tax=Anaeramoeba flamelloides TaxID=1746091 RepID=A0AAV8A8N5_9EUKA|nr:e3 ubiquitin-protein ligase trim [Anaeramoeba flamelloides]
MTDLTNNNVFHPIEAQTNKQIVQCEVCNQKPATTHCSACSISYCNSCEVHIPLLKEKHKNFISNLNEKGPIFSKLCHKHQKAVILYCLTHNELICSQCIDEECKDHLNQFTSIKKISNIFEKESKELLKKFTEQQKQILQFANTITKRNDILNQNYLDVVNMIKTNCQFLQKKINETMEYNLDILNKIIFTTNYKNKLILDRNQKIDKYIKKPDEFKETLQKLKEEKRDIDLVQYSKMIQTELKDIVKIAMKEQASVNNEMFNANFKTKFIQISRKSKRITTVGKEWGEVCGDQIYQRGKHVINIKIDQFPQSTYEKNRIFIGIIKSNKREDLSKEKQVKKIYFYQTFWSNTTKETSSYKTKFSPHQSSTYGQPFEQGAIVNVYLDMYNRELSFGINNQKMGICWGGIPKKVSLYILLEGQRLKKNIITILK